MIDVMSTEKGLIGEVWTSPSLYANLETLCDFGSRFGGTPSERQARDFLLERFRAYGLTNVHLEPFEYTGWQRGTCHLTVLEPVQRELPAISLVYSPSTPPDGLRAEVVNLGVGTEQDFQRAGKRVAGRIVLCTSATLQEQGKWVHRREKYGRAVAAGAVGFLFVNHVPGLLAPTGSVRPGRLGEIPAAGLAWEHGFDLIRWSKRGPVEVNLNIQNTSGPAEAWHVVGEVPGQREDEVILIGAHYDGHDISQGAMDDAAGIALLLELARLFAPLANRLRRSLRFVAFDVEELGVLGSTEYVRQHADEMDRIKLMINMDSGVGSGPVQIATSGCDELMPLLARYAQEMGEPLDIRDQIATATDSFPFLMAGVPALNLPSRGRDPRLGRGFGHTAADTLDKVSELDLKHSAMVLARILLRLAEEAEEIGRHRTPDEVRSLLQEHNLEQPLRAQGKWPAEW